jgi:hypothetical protein
MVRACERCGTVCSTDQEWCLNCGVRLTEASQRLPGLRAAGLVVALAVLLAGGAAAASYAALRGDTRSAANVPVTTTAPPVAQVPPTTTAPPVDTAVPTTGDPTASVPDTSATPDTSDVTPEDPNAGLPSTSSDAGSLDLPDDSGAGATPGGTGGAAQTPATPPATTPPTTTPTKTEPTKTEPTKTDTTKTDADKPDDDSGPLTFATGQGSIYDPSGVVADAGLQGNAIDGSTGSSWKVKLNEDQSGGFGYVLDFTPATAVKTVNVVSGTAGLKVKVLGTTQSALPPDVVDSGWETLASEKTLKTGPNPIALEAVSGKAGKYRHVLIFVTEAPGTPAAATIREIRATR